MRISDWSSDVCSSDLMDEPRQDEKREISFFATMIAIFWSFIGLRRHTDYEKDVTGLNPVYVIVAGLIGAAIFIGVLLTIVNMVEIGRASCRERVCQYG